MSRTRAKPPERLRGAECMEQLRRFTTVFFFAFAAWDTPDAFEKRFERIGHGAAGDRFRRGVRFARRPYVRCGQAAVSAATE